MKRKATLGSNIHFNYRRGARVILLNCRIGFSREHRLNVVNNIYACFDSIQGVAWVNYHVINTLKQYLKYHQGERKSR